MLLSECSLSEGHFPFQQGTFLHFPTCNRRGLCTKVDTDRVTEPAAMRPVLVLARVAHELLSVVGWLSMHIVFSSSLMSSNTHNSQVDNHGVRVGYVRFCAGNPLLTEIFSMRC
jgi:hypothetical protein